VYKPKGYASNHIHDASINKSGNQLISKQYNGPNLYCIILFKRVEGDLKIYGIKHIYKCYICETIILFHK
jgi:hypothetical protein